MQARPEQLYLLPLSETGNATRRTLLEYLLSSHPLNNIVGLPLIPLASDADVHFALERVASVECYIFNDDEAALFGRIPTVPYALSANIPSVFNQALLNSSNLRRPSSPAVVVGLAKKALKYFDDWHWRAGASQSKAWRVESQSLLRDWHYSGSSLNSPNVHVVAATCLT